MKFQGKKRGFSETFPESLLSLFMSRDSRHRCWVFTWNNPPMVLIDWEVLGTPLNRSTYLVYQLEAAATTGTLHYQGYVCFKQGVTLNAMRRDFPGARLAPAKGTPEKNFTYCTKDDPTYIDGPWEHGVKPVGQGQRTDIMKTKSLVDGGKLGVVNT